MVAYLSGDELNFGQNSTLTANVDFPGTQLFQFRQLNCMGAGGTPIYVRVRINYELRSKPEIENEFLMRANLAQYLV